MRARRALGAAALGPGRGLGRGLGEGPGELRGGVGDPESGLAEGLLHGVEQFGVDAVGEFHLDLGPGGGGLAALGQDGVGAQFREQGPVGVEQMADAA